jgi:hypothetical protein
LRQDARSFVWDHVEFPDDRLYDVVTAWIIHTWIPELLQTTGYIHFFGEPDTGKTRGLEVLKALSYRGLLTSDISEAVLYRSIESWHPTLLLDESDIYTLDQRLVIQNLLNSGYRKGEYALRIIGMEKDEPKVGLFDVFGPKSLAGTTGFKGTLESRTIRIVMEMNQRPLLNILSKASRARALNLRSRFLLWRWRKLVDGFDGFDGFLEGAESRLSFANGRFVELYTPLLAVANEGTEAILEYAKKAYSDRKREVNLSNEGEIFQLILNNEPHMTDNRFSTSKVAMDFNSLRDSKGQWSNERVGWSIRRLGFKPCRMSDSTRGWFWDDERVQRLEARFAPPPEKPSEPSKPSNLREKLNAALQAVESASMLMGEAKEETVLKLLEDIAGIDGEEGLKLLRTLERDRIIFSPRPGIWKRT